MVKYLFVSPLRVHQYVHLSPVRNSGSGQRIKGKRRGKMNMNPQKSRGCRVRIADATVIGNKVFVIQMPNAAITKPQTIELSCETQPQSLLLEFRIDFPHRWGA